MRVFFALEPEADTTRTIADWRDRQFGPCGKPVPAANFHLTLAFLGELKPARLEQLCLAVDERIRRDQPAGGSIKLDITGYWPKPGIYWLGCNQPPPQLLRLADALRGLCSAAGGKRDNKVFQPHITLFRGCETAPPAPATIPPLQLNYRHFTLLESKLGKSGVSYHPVQDWELPADKVPG